MYSLNVPLPPAVERLTDELYPLLTAFDSIRERHTLVCKRFGAGISNVDASVSNRSDPAPRSKDAVLSELRTELRPLLEGTDPFEARIGGVDYFERAAQGPDPVVYLAVESPDLERLHHRLCAAYDPVEGIEGDDYVPHVTLARGGGVDEAERARDVDVEPVSWTVDELSLWDPEFREPAGTISLPPR